MRPTQLLAKVPHSCQAHGAASLAVHGVGWAFLSPTRHVEQEESECRAANWQRVTSPGRGALRWKLRDVLQHQAQLNVTVCHLHTPDSL